MHDRRHVMGLALGIAAAAAAGAEAQPHGSGHHGEAIPMSLEAYIDACLKCHRSCTEAAVGPLPAPPGRSAPAFAALLQDCAQICQAAADSMTRKSPAHGVFCDACAQVCDACAEACGAGSVAALRDLARLCRDCASACRHMASMA